MKRVIFSITIVTMVLMGCTKVERKQPQEISPIKQQATLDGVGTPSIINIQEKIQEYIKKMSPEEMIGQLLMPAFRAFQYEDSVEVLTDSMEEILEVYKVGGVILFKENIKDKNQVQLLIKELQGKSDIPLWIGVDEEGGQVSRIASNPDMGYELVAPAFEIGEKGSKAEAYEAGKQLATILKELGFNMDFAPVADIWSNPNNEVIGRRSFGDNPDLVSEMVDEVVRGLQEEEIASVIKHFPGHGDTSEDSHVERAFVNRSFNELLERELIPFQRAIDKGVEGVMVGHIELPQIDEGVPATLSYKIITKILKKEMNFQGLIITDALDMEAITKQFGEGEAALTSFMAGADILLMPGIEEAQEYLLKAYGDGTITSERLEESVYKILYTKYKYGIIEEDFFD